MSDISNHINHIAFVVDASGSMGHLTDAVVSVFDNQIKHLARRSQELDQETRVSVYMFNNGVDCIIFDKDVMRLPSLRSFYRPDGGTALIDGTLQSIDDLEKTAQMYGDHAFLIYAITDGQENASKAKPAKLKTCIDKLPDNWTIAALVPNASGVHEAKQFGFGANNIMIWDATAKGIAELGQKLEKVNEGFMQARKSGVRGSKSLFVIDTSKLSSKKVNDNLDALKSSEYWVIEVRRDATIKDLVEREVGTFVKGSAYYQLTKLETVQGYKKICIRNKISKYVYSGDKARKLLGLPDHDLKLKPEQLSKFDVFVQSTSVNRKLIGGTELIVLK